MGQKTTPKNDSDIDHFGGQILTPKIGRFLDHFFRAVARVGVGIWPQSGAEAGPSGGQKLPQFGRGNWPESGVEAGPN